MTKIAIRMMMRSRREKKEKEEEEGEVGEDEGGYVV